jgi:hypothetical protein
VEKLQLRRDFPTNLLIKTYVSLWKSCRSIAPLQLLFLEIFKFYSKILRFAFSKGAAPNKNEHPCVGLAFWRHGRRSRARHVSPAYPSGVRTLDAPWWAERPGGPRATQRPYTAPRGQPPPLDTTRHVVSMPPAAAHAARARWPPRGRQSTCHRLDLVVPVLLAT